MDIDAILGNEDGVIKNILEVTEVRYRAVYGRKKYSGSVLLNDDVMDTLNEFIELAPLHNPLNILGIKVC